MDTAGGKDVNLKYSFPLLIFIIQGYRKKIFHFFHLSF